MYLWLHIYIELQFMYVPKDKNHITYRGSITHILNFLNSTTTTIPPTHSPTHQASNNKKRRKRRISTHITPYAFPKTECRIFIPYSCFSLVLVLMGKSYTDLEGGIRSDVAYLLVCPSFSLYI